jgi:hypothetical protein
VSGSLCDSRARSCARTMTHTKASVNTLASWVTFPFRMATMEDATKKNARMMYVLVPRHLFTYTHHHPPRAHKHEAATRACHTSRPV